MGVITRGALQGEHAPEIKYLDYSSSYILSSKAEGLRIYQDRRET